MGRDLLDKLERAAERARSEHIQAQSLLVDAKRVALQAADRWYAANRAYREALAAEDSADNSPLPHPQEQK